MATKAARRHERLAAQTERRLGDVNADLDAWRLEVVRRTELVLMGL